MELQTSPGSAGRSRLESIDLVRGLIMVVMALDHARDMLGSSHFDPTDLSRTTPLLFFTRLATHLCAPGFVLLAGAGAFLSRKPAPELSRFLLTRGLWLVVVEVTLVKLAWTFNFDPRQTGLQVIWAIGWSMVALAGLVRLPLRAAGAIGALLICAHDLFDGVTAGPLLGPSREWSGSARDWLVAILHVRRFPVIYPLVPWIGVMALGYALGPIFLFEPPRRRRVLVALGLALGAAFIGIRALNGYGDPDPWSPQQSPLYTALSFLRTEKYPPSLDYLLMTLGPILLLLAAAEKVRWAPFAVLGRVPFFFYVAHLYALHALAVALGVATGFGARALLVGWPWFPNGFGLPLAGVYLAWVLVVVGLYPACRWFARLKANRREAWLSYL